MSVQLITEHSSRPRRFTPQQKLQVLKEWELIGNGVEVAKKYQIHPQTLYRWRKALEQQYLRMQQRHLRRLNEMNLDMMKDSYNQWKQWENQYPNLKSDSQWQKAMRIYEETIRMQEEDVQMQKGMGW